MRIKLCGVRTVEDALLCAEEGADEIGVIFAPKSKRRVTVVEAKAIRAALPSHLPLVGVFLDAPLDEVVRVAREVGLQAAQLHGAWPLSTAADLALYAALQVTDESALQPRPGAARILLDGPAGGSGKSFAWTLAARAKAFGTPLFIAGGLTPENVAEAIAEAQPSGVDVASGIENAKGYKDPARVRAFVRAARGASFK
ncbi:MAG: phosphoribosylanthranilate isomerase [Myxococcales bacterium]|nr:phosphoribosylanthranilate isomerase [Myxococcales bacterium]